MSALALDFPGRGGENEGLFRFVAVLLVMPVGAIVGRHWNIDSVFKRGGIGSKFCSASVPSYSLQCLIKCVKISLVLVQIDGHGPDATML